MNPRERLTLHQWGSIHYGGRVSVGNYLSLSNGAALQESTVIISTGLTHGYLRGRGRVFKIPVYGLAFGFQGSRFRIKFGVEGSGFRVYIKGLGFRVHVQSLGGLGYLAQTM